MKHPPTARPLFSQDVTPCLTIKFSPHIIWLATDKIPREREAGTLFMALTLANQDVSVGSGIPSVERPREMSRAKVNAKSLRIINKSARNY